MLTASRCDTLINHVLNLGLLTELTKIRWLAFYLKAMFMTGRS